MTDSATFTTPEADEEDLEDLEDLLLEALPGDGSTTGNQSAREALSRAAERQVSEEEYEALKERALNLGLVVKGRGRGGSIALAEGIEGGSRYEAPSASAAGNSRGRAKKEAPVKDFKAVLWASADRLRAQMDAAEYKHLVLSIDWQYKENVRAELRTMVKALLKLYEHLPYQEASAIDLLLIQAETLSEDLIEELA